jgi:hypothetical protein
MGASGLRAAREHRVRLQAFASLAEATLALFQLRDKLLAELVTAAEQSRVFEPSFKPESLKELEHWYFNLWERDAFSAINFERERFEQAMAMYIGETAVRTNSRFEWFVEEYAFQPGKFELGVRRPLFSWMLLGACRDHFSRPVNKRRESIWREFQQHVA